MFVTHIQRQILDGRLTPEAAAQQRNVQNMEMSIRTELPKVVPRISATPRDALLQRRWHGLFVCTLVSVSSNIYYTSSSAGPFGMLDWLRLQLHILQAGLLSSAVVDKANYSISLLMGRWC